MHYRQAFWNCFLICKWNTHSCKGLIRISPVRCKSKWGIGLFMFILCVRLVEKDRGLLVEADERYNERHNCAAIDVYFKEWAVRAVVSPAQRSCVLVSLFWTMESDYSEWAWWYTSVKTPTLFHCSIYFHLQVSYRSTGQHAVSLPVSSAVERTYVVDKCKTKPPACHSAFSSVAFSSPLSLLSTFWVAISLWLVICSNASISLVWFNLN